jgi:4-hydroxy-3-methylbut-2-enyl diphosphate reductase
MEMVLAETNKRKGPLYTFGPLIHNTQVTDLLESKGVQSIDSLAGIQTGEIVIRAHGIPPQIRQSIKKTGLNIIDATCPRVAKVHAIIRSHTRKGYTAIIIGDRDHAEVIGLMGYSEGPVHVIQSVKDVATLPHLDRLFVVAQTTQNQQNFHVVVQELKKRFPQVLVFDTICDATNERQKEVKSFAGQVDAVVVVGGSHSANTRRLAEVSSEAGLPTFHVETEQDLKKDKLSGMEIIGVTAGASTPNWMLKNVVKKIEGIRSRSESPLFRWIRPFLKFLVLTNLAVSCGAFSFAYAASIVLEHNPGFTFPFITFLYVYAMHVLNRFLDKGASAYNDPESAAFLKKYRTLLIMTAITAVTVALVVSLSVGLSTFLALSGLSFLGIVYSIPFIPERFRHKTTYAKIKDIPGSRSLSESLAWVAIITLLPLLDMPRIAWPSVAVTSLIVFSMSYARAILFNIFQAQGDLIVGTETMPIILGEEKTLTLLKVILLASAFILIISPVLHLVNTFSFVLLLPLCALSLCLFSYEKRWLYPGTILEVLVEGTFLLSGFLALIWHIMLWQP